MTRLTPRSIQEHHITTILAEPTKAALEASDVGAGKTLILSEVAIRAGWNRVLIVGIKDTFSQWAKRLESQGCQHALKRIDSTAAGKRHFAELLAGADGFYFIGSQMLQDKDWTRIFLTGEDGRRIIKVTKATNQPVLKESKAIGPQLVPVFETKRKHLFTYRKMRQLDALIYDEAHTGANRKSNTIGTIRTIPTEWRLALSATFYGNKFEHAHTITRWLWPDVKNAEGDYLIDPRVYAWRDQWCVTEEKFVGRAKPVQSVLGERVPGAFVATLPCYLRIEAEKQAPEPEVLRVPLSAEEWAMYSQMEEDGVMWLDSHGGLEPLVANLPIVKRIRLRTAALGAMSLDANDEPYFAPTARSTKMHALRFVLEREDFRGKPAVIFTHSKKFASVVAERMTRAGFRTLLWTGDVPSKKRDELKAEFMAQKPGEPVYIVAVIESLSTGYDGLQTVCSRVIWMSESDSTKENHQALGRVFRQGGDLEGFKHVKIVAVDTVDDGVLLTNQARSYLNGITLAAQSVAA